MQLISRAWPEALSARADEAKELSRLLGEDHDLAVLLAKRHRGRRRDSLTREDIAAIAALCRSCQAEIRALAEPRGARLFAEPAEELRRRIEAYWSSACRLRRVQPARGAPCAPPQALDRRAPHTSPQGPGRLNAVDTAIWPRMQAAELPRGIKAAEP